MSQYSAIVAAAGDKCVRDDSTSDERCVHPRPPHTGSCLPEKQPPQKQRPVLHRHALESVFAFCELAELPAVAAVARDWRAATLSMAPLQCLLTRCTAARVVLLCDAPLRRHVSRLSSRNRKIVAELPLDTVRLLAQRMPHLQVLDIAMPCSGPVVPLVLPPLLRDLTLWLRPAEDDAEGTFATLFNAAVTAAAELVQLEKLILGLLQEHWSPNCSFAPLQRALCLHDFSLIGERFADPLPLTDKQVDEIRELDCLHSVWLCPLGDLLPRLLAVPHTLCWRELDQVESITEEVAALLVNLPLTMLDATQLDMPHADFLSRLPQLTDLSLGSVGDGPPDTPRILQAAGASAGLRSLSLHDTEEANGLHFTSIQLGECLPQLPALARLSLVSPFVLSSLSFLAAGSLPRTLTELNLYNCHRRVPLADVQFVLALSELRELTLGDVFAEAPTEADEPFCRLEPPSSLLPRLESFGMWHR